MRLVQLFYPIHGVGRIENIAHHIIVWAIGESYFLTRMELVPGCTVVNIAGKAGEEHD